MKKLGILIGVIIVVLLAAIGGIYATRNYGKSEEQVNEETATMKMERLYEKIDPKTVEPKMEKLNETYESEEDNLGEELPDIQKYPLTVKGDGEIDVEIFSSPEKAGDKTDGWLIEVAKKFNEEEFQVNEKNISVSIRKIDSGLGMDYISSRKHQPQAYSPSNELWEKMLEAKGIDIELKTDRLVGNVAGILIKKDVYKTLEEKYGIVNIKTIVEATTAGEIKMGYTNPFLSSSGLNFIISTLYSFDEEDPFSETAKEGFNKFQNNIPLLAYTTMQLRQSALKGSIDTLIIESQSLANLPELSDFKFIPYGVRHDEPLYVVGNISQEENETVDKFVEYCKNQENQELADKYGFNQQEQYVCELTEFTGQELIRAQALYKEEKDAGKEIKAVFVADISGSMDGARINSLKKSLVNSAKYINTNNSIGLVTYDSDVYINLPIGKFDITQMSKFVGTVNSLSTGGNTATYDAVLVAANMLMKEKDDNSKLIIFLLSDGETNCGRVGLKDLKEIMSELKIQIYTIGYNAQIDELKEISEINEAATINADNEDVVYQLKNLFNSQM